MCSPKVISFDLDGTLLCGAVPDLVDAELAPLVSATGVREDRMRLGAVPLLKGLAADGHQIWIYTQSLRGKREVTDWLESFGVSLAGYVNLPLHETACEQHGIVGIRPRKCPHLFGIDVHVDDDPEVAREGQELGFKVILTDPAEVDFERSVYSFLREIDSPR